MVRISDLVKAHQDSIVTPASYPQEQASVESPGLYQQLVAESGRCLEQVQYEQRIKLGDIPLLIEQALDRVTAEDAELLRLSMDGASPFSLPSHGVNVAILSLRVGIELGMRRASLVDLGVAALLHDIGMMKIRHLLTAPHHLNSEQVEEMKEHPIWGERIAQRSSELPPIVRDVIAQEHERQDGTGYPRRLSGETIQNDAQVVGLADMYEALTHNRPYRARLLSAEAARVMTEQHKEAFRRPLLRAFLRGVPIFPAGSWVRLNTGDLAQVSQVSVRFPLMPTVSIRYDRMRQPYPNDHTLDLSRDSQISIIEAIFDPTPAQRLNMD